MSPEIEDSFYQEVEFCENCDKDIRHGVYFVFDSRSDDHICTNCGNVYRNEGAPRRLIRYSSRGVVLDNATPGTIPAHGSKNTYNRRAHINERLSSANIMDPIISTEDFAQIKKEFERFLRTNWFFRQRAERRRLDKRDVQSILRSIDKRAEKRSFCVQYLEKWKSILADLLHFEPEKYSYDETGVVGAYFQMISNAWNTMQPPHDKQARGTWKFKERRHCPNFNFLFQRIHCLIGSDMPKRYDKEFPIPKNPKAVERLWRWWEAIAAHLNLPFNEKNVGQGYSKQKAKSLQQQRLDKWLKRRLPKNPLSASSLRTSAVVS